MTYNVETFGFSQKGFKKKTNEDHWLLNRKDNIFAIADGVGSLKHGGTASKLALEMIKSHSSQFIIEPKKVIEIINKSIYRINLKFEKAILATTLSSIFLKGNIITFVHVGDGKIYLVKKDNIRQISSDQVFNNKTKAIGVTPTIIPQISTARLSNHNIYHVIICSDGASKMKKNFFFKIISEFNNFPIIGKLIQNYSIKQKNFDDITILLIKIFN